MSSEGHSEHVGQSEQVGQQEEEIQQYEMPMQQSHVLPPAYGYVVDPHYYTHEGMMSHHYQHYMASLR